jgi:hypothetical protein
MYFQKRNLAVPAMLLLVLICTALLAAKDNPMGIAEKQTISFTVPTVVGGTLLPAGNYNVTHEMKGQTHVMIFQQIGGKKAEAKANCNLVPLKAKAEQTEQVTITNAKNERVLEEMTFAGDKATHVLVP